MKIRSTVTTLKALAHPVRLRILAMLRGGDLCVCQMTAVLELAPSTVSAHLADLKRGGFVDETKKGRWVIYRLGEGQWETTLLESVWGRLAREPRIAADARLLKRLRKVDVEELCRASLDLRSLGIRRPGPDRALETNRRTA